MRHQRRKASDEHRDEIVATAPSPLPLHHCPSTTAPPPLPRSMFRVAPPSVQRHHTTDCYYELVLLMYGWG